MKRDFTKRRCLFYSAVLAGISLFGYSYATPYLSILSLKTAIESKDAKLAEKYIDFPSLRKNLKSQLTNALSKRASKERLHMPLGQLSVMIFNPVLGVVVDSTIDFTVTPTGLELLLMKGELHQRKLENNKFATQEKSISKARPEITLYYQGFNSFILNSKPNKRAESIKAYWTRNGIFKWKLRSVDIPMEILNNIK